MRALGVLLLLAATAQAAEKVGTFAAESRVFYTTAHGLPSDDVRAVAIEGGRVFALTAKGAARLTDGKWAPAAGMPKASRTALPAATARDGARNWALDDVRASTCDSLGRIWFASPQGVGRYENGRWKLYTPAEGLPYDDFTCVAGGENGVVWFGTRKGAIRFDGRVWEYRQGLRWLPDDDVRGIAVEPDGSAWFATARGVGHIARKPMTLAGKAKFFEEEIDARHRRTEHGYVLEVTLKRPGDKSEWVQHDSDNDGLWTSMYGAAQCFAWAATKDPQAKRRAGQALEALRFLRLVTQGGSHPAPPGFVARTVLPASGPDPNAKQYTRDRDEQTRATRDRLWKVIVPRWPVSADGMWYWKTDTSSDELDGHFFFYGLYHDLVAETDVEKRLVREQVAAIADHLLKHDFTLVDHDGKPTRWGVFNPESLNHDPSWWEERGLNSLSILSYLKTAEHVTGDARYREAYRKLVEEHAYATNVLIPKTNAGSGTGNQSDDEMYFMSWYNLVRYEADPLLAQRYAKAWHRHWLLERPEINPLFNFMYAALCSGRVFSDAFGVEELSPDGDWLADSVDTLRRYPLDRVSWGLRNSHRKDIVPLAAWARERGTGEIGYRNNGKVLPIDERFVEHWNHNPWVLDFDGNGTEVADGASFLLPYYMGLYHKFIAE